MMSTIETIKTKDNMRGNRSKMIETYGYYISTRCWGVGRLGDENFISEIQINENRDLAIKILELNDIDLGNHSCIDTMMKAGCIYTEIVSLLLQIKENGAIRQ